MKKDSELLSIIELLDRLSIDNKNAFKLFIGQRSFDWDKVRVTNLIDSLLRGFPIGSMLVDEGRQYFNFSQKGDEDSMLRSVKKTLKKRVRIIDGQQRCYSIQNAYTKKGLYNTKTGKDEFLWINVLKKNSAFKEFDEKKGQKYYFQWSSQKNINNLTPKERKVEFDVRLPENGWRLFYKIIDKLKKIEDKKIKNEIKNFARDIVNDFIDESQDRTQYIQLCQSFIQDIWDSLFNKRIPIHYIQKKTDDVHDLFQVFIRINTGGVPLAPVDVFFTGVKKYWQDAEEHLKYIVNDDSIFDRRNAITILARCSGMSLKDNIAFDPYRMGLQQINRNAIGDADPDKRYPLINRMRELTKDKNTKFVMSVKWTTNLMRKHLFYASNITSPFLIMPVIAWSYQFLCQNKKLPHIGRSRKFIKPIIKYLFWTQVLGSRKYGRGKFDRLCFYYAWEAGKHVEVFPWQDRDLQECCFNFDRIRRQLPKKPRINSLAYENEDGSAERIRNLMFWNRTLFLSSYQEIPYNITDIDWDHLIAYNYARNRFKKGRKVNWNYMKWINQAGNFSGIDSRINRSLQDNPPSIKFRTDDKDFNYRKKKFVKTNPKLDETEINMCLSVERYFNNGKTQKAAMKTREFSCKRSKKIWDNALQKFGEPPRINAEY
jgi:hypothetical protein